MPEGPEVRLEADRIAAVLLDQQLAAASCALPRWHARVHALAGCRVTSVTTRGKALLIGFDDDRVLYTHNQLYGRWFVRRRGEVPRTARSLRVALHTTTHSALLYSASTIELLPVDALATHPFLSRLGPDVLDPALDWCHLAARLDERRFRARTLGTLLLDQAFLAGIGNYLRSEILFFARLAAHRRPCELSRGERQRLVRQALAVTRRAYRTRGVTNRAAQVTRLERDGVPRGACRFAVFGRAGAPCYDCATPIERLQVGSRRLYWCPTCQGVT